MKIDILTLFPNMYQGIFDESIIKRAVDEGRVEINIHNFRDYTLDPHKKVDDTPYGGGAGMVLTCQPIFDCVKSLRNDDSIVILMTPDGEVYKQKKAYELSKKKHLILICGHYEGFDERIRSICDMEISIGDYVLTGGELPAMVVIDSAARLVEGVISEESLKDESHTSGLLEYPQYTKPAIWEGLEVPSVLLSGNHKNIEDFRKKKSLELTMKNRPDLLN